jgi:hypothetical protein
MHAYLALNKKGTPMKKTFALGLASLLACSALLPVAAQEKTPRYEKRWVYMPFNLLVDKNVDEVLTLLERARKSGYNGIVLADYKFNVLDRLPPRYFKNVERVKLAAAAAGIEIIPTVFPMGYSAGLLAHDPNLAEGIPVKAAPFTVKKGEAVPDQGAVLRNGGLEDVKKDRFAGFSFQDEPGKATFADAKVKHSGKLSCRMQDFDKTTAGNCRLAQRVSVRPYACYQVSAWVKTSDLKPAGNVRLTVLGKDGKALSFFDEHLKETQDWTYVDVVFNSLEETEITLYAGIWGGKQGTLWLDDLQLEELSLVNPLRRAGCPLTVASADGKTVYEEGKDFLPVADPKLGKVPGIGDYSFAHPGAALRLTDSSRIKEGDSLRVSWYHPILTHKYQVMCCLSDAKVYDLMRAQVQAVDKLLKPKTYFMSHDEIRVANWCQECQSRKLTPGALLADNVRRCTQLIKDVNPDAQIIVWSDMFDPNHNAVDRYYLVNGSWKGSWDGLPARVMVANWNDGNAEKSLQWFDKRGHGQIIAGYYDGDLRNFHKWNAAAKNIPTVRGFMYTTRQRAAGMTRAARDTNPKRKRGISPVRACASGWYGISCRSPDASMHAGTLR